MLKNKNTRLAVEQSPVQEFIPIEFIDSVAFQKFQTDPQLRDNYDTFSTKNTFAVSGASFEKVSRALEEELEKIKLAPNIYISNVIYDFKEIIIYFSNLLLTKFKEEGIVQGKGFFIADGRVACSLTNEDFIKVGINNDCESIISKMRSLLVQEANAINAITPLDKQRLNNVRSQVSKFVGSMLMTTVEIILKDNKSIFSFMAFTEEEVQEISYIIGSNNQVEEFSFDPMQSKENKIRDAISKEILPGFDLSLQNFSEVPEYFNFSNVTDWVKFRELAKRFNIKGIEMQDRAFFSAPANKRKIYFYLLQKNNRDMYLVNSFLNYYIFTNMQPGQEEYKSYHLGYYFVDELKGKKEQFLLTLVDGARKLEAFKARINDVVEEIQGAINAASNSESKLPITEIRKLNACATPEELKRKDEFLYNRIVNMVRKRLDKVVHEVEFQDYTVQKP
jgi:hypothetical protein